MITDTRDRIIEYIRYHGQARAQDIYETFRISRVAVHKHLKKLLAEGILIRVGNPPVVFYTFPPEVTLTLPREARDLPAYYQQVIDAHFLSITPDGKLLYGMPGFFYWAHSYQKQKALARVAEDYIETIQAQMKLVSPEGWIDATAKLRESFQETPISQLLFMDVFSYKTFGRTKLAKLVMYAKQIGDKKLIGQVADLAKPLIAAIIQKYHIEAVAFIPPTVPRPVQFMDYFESQLQLRLPKIELVKIVPGDIPIPQKTLASLDERVINARDTIYLKSTKTFSYENVLLIDDVIGSGASFQETAKKLKHNNIGYGEIIAFGLVGNIKGFDVVREI